MSDMESTEYTPTTNLVRAAYTRAVPESLVVSQAEMMAEFDRWFAGALADAWDEGVIDGVWNEEHAGMIKRGIREVIVNPYWANGEGKTS